jgi:transcriptional regulator with GAF, ATPase, and Fis domain
MSQLVVFDPKQGRESIYHLKKRLTTIGSEREHDIVVDSNCSGVHFSVSQLESSKFEIQAGNAKLKQNGNRVGHAALLRSCDRLEWEGLSAVFISSRAEIASDGKSEKPTLAILQNLTNALQNTPDFSGAFLQLLDTLIELSGAEDGLILSDLGGSTGWSAVASRGRAGIAPKQLFSDTLLNEVLKTREPLYIESIVGNPFANAQSVILAKIFSAACIPLIVGDRILGAVFLHTHSPGKHIQRNMLLELRVLATQAALMLISTNEISTQLRENRGLNKKLSSSKGSFESAFVYQHPSMAEVVKMISRLAPSPLGILITGATGTGKEIAAKEIHRLSARKDQPFVAINCAAIPATLLESTLFGYEKGAFTGADRARIGKFEQANGGTLFLDEIGDLPLELQAKLLRALQEKAIDPVGATQPRSIDVRVIAATHRDLDSMVAKGEFRQDFYFRLAGAKVRLPALRERGDDVVLIAGHLLERMAPGKEFSPEAMKKLKSHAWPGNVRELEHVITRAAVLSEAAVISESEIEIDHFVSVDSVGLTNDLNPDATLEQAQLRFTQKFVQDALERNGGSRSQTAKNLGISERTLYRILAESLPSSELSARSDRSL